MLADVRTDAAEARTLFGWAAGGVVLGLIVWSGLLRRVEHGLAARRVSVRLTPLILATVFALVFQASMTVLGLVSTALWPNGDVTTAPWVQSLSAALLQGVIGAVGLALLLMILQAAPRWGWAGLSGFAALAIFFIVLVPPLAASPGLRGDRQVAGPEATPILDFVQRGGLAADRLYVFDSADPVAVDMEGLGPFTHAAVSRAALAGPRPETYAAIGHLLGHYRHKDLWSLALLWSGFATAFLFAVSQALKSSWTAGAKALPLIGLIAWIGLGLATPVFDLFDQAINDRADDYALSLTHDPDALCRWLIATEAHSKAEPSPIESLVFYDHPPLGPRLANALGWKTAHGL